MKFRDILKRQFSKHNNKVHAVLAHSYSMYFFAFILGAFCNIFTPIKFFNSIFISWVGAIVMLVSSCWILWAQRSSTNFKNEIITKETFMKGPYRLTRNPTNLGLFFLMLSFGITAKSIFIILFSFIAFLVSLLVFIKIEEELLAAKYGEPYKEYQNTVLF